MSHHRTVDSAPKGLDWKSLGLALTAQAPVPMAMLAGAGHWVGYANPAFCRLMGRPLATLTGRPFTEILAKRDECLALLDRVFREGRPATHTAQEHAEPSPVFWAYTMWPVLEAGETAGVVLQVTETASLHEHTVAMNEALLLGSVRQHELTEAAETLNARLQAEIGARQEATRELAEKARLLDLSFDAVVVRDMEGHITYWNRGAEELYGWPRAAALGKVSHDLLQTEFAVPIERMLEELQRTGRWTGELGHTACDGRRLTVLVRKTLDRDSAGKGIAVLEYMTDITRRKEMEEALRHAKTRLADRAGQLAGLVAERTAELSAMNQQLEAFVYSIAHDLRAPLRSMQGFAELLVGDSASRLSPAGRDFAGRIDKSAQAMDAMLGDLLAFCRLGQRQVVLAPVRLAAVVDTVLERLQSDLQRTKARVERKGPWPAVLAHETTLIQVLVNLVSNALKFVVPERGPTVRLRAEKIEGSVRVWVEDNGPGIAPEHQTEIFRLFNRLEGEKHPGTGVGLAIVQTGVERMGGRVGLESAAGEGCRFWFELRAA